MGNYKEELMRSGHTRPDSIIVKEKKMKWSLKCPECGYTYGIEGEKYEWETCPICGHGAPLIDFIVGEDDGS